MNRLIASISNYLAALILLLFGVTYLLRNSFMPYHSEALSADWNDLDKHLQILIIALMKVIAGGYLSVSLLIFFLQKKFNQKRIYWIPPLILICGVLISCTSIYATLLVRLHTHGQPPIQVAIAGLVLLIIGYVFNKRQLKRHRK